MKPILARLIRCFQPEMYFFYYIRDLNKYGACQILAIAKEGICNVVLDNLKDTPLNQDDLKDIKPLSTHIENHYFQCYVSFSTIPHSYIYVGNTANVVTKFERAYSKLLTCRKGAYLS